MPQPIRRLDILLHTYLPKYKALLDDDELTTSELVSIWKHMLGEINSYTVVANYNDICRNVLRRMEAEKCIKQSRQAKARPKFDKAEYDNDIDREDEIPEADMEKMSQSLINQYQFESKKANTIIITEEQYKRLFK